MKIIEAMRGDLKEARDAEYWGLAMTRQIILFICHRTIQGCLVYLLGRHTLLRQSVIKPGLRSKLSAFDLLSNLQFERLAQERLTLLPRAS